MVACLASSPSPRTQAKHEGQDEQDMFVPAHFSPIRRLNADSSPVSRMRTPDRHFEMTSPVQTRDSCCNSTGKRKIAMLSGQEHPRERSKLQDLHERVLKLARDCNFDLTRISTGSCVRESKGKSAMIAQEQEENTRENDRQEPREGEEDRCDNDEFAHDDEGVGKCWSGREDLLQIQPHPPSEESKFLRRDPRRCVGATFHLFLHLAYLSLGRVLQETCLVETS
eukprot:755579-Hanusia_phi.AAC.1